MEAIEHVESLPHKGQHQDEAYIPLSHAIVTFEQ